MPLFTVAILAGLQGFAEVLPISASGHGIVAKLWMDGDEGVSPAILSGAILVAMAVALRSSLVAAVGEGIRAVARPILFTTSPGAQVAAVTAVTTAVSLGVGAALGPFVDEWGQEPLGIGVGLVVTAVGLSSTRLAPRAYLEAPSLLGAVLVGVAHGYAVAPGISRVGMALTLLLWLRVKAPRALELALLLSLPGLVIAFVEGMLVGRPTGAPTEVGTAITGLVVAFLAAGFACMLLRALVSRGRLALFALWLMPLGLATIAYARALPEAAPSDSPLAAGEG